MLGTCHYTSSPEGRLLLLPPPLWTGVLLLFCGGTGAGRRGLLCVYISHLPVSSRPARRAWWQKAPRRGAAIYCSRIENPRRKLSSPSFLPATAPFVFSFFLTALSSSFSSLSAERSSHSSFCAPSVFSFKTNTNPHTVRFNAHLLALLFVPLFVAHLLRYATRVILPFLHSFIFIFYFFATRNNRTE